ncbi:SpoIIE family protein phosphatase [Tepidibacter formicigenes]|jgi:hypothetical protein|uniref:Stage II sporulation protein E (SpoIIE) n=1 Tax=Tepidibacter formicigenes DSM 15518 TaxID=1123349 RepID=A0A1M6KNU4_9FIRM|nr:SpoIIE family protein phosphatase [Tepidibacter formicigenes]SHJ60560.1 Stage II sporulation protein E (SpoIIE) [Tepidibacter formicigenes DSM 15518]
MRRIKRYFVDIGYLSLNKYCEELCGDNVEIERFDEGVIAVLSDGLGSGVKANILATLTSKIAVTMIKNGLTIEDVVNTIINTLPTCKVRNLAYSTFTIIYILHSGECYIARFDNPPVLLKREGKVIPIQEEEILISGRKVKEIKINLKKEDTLISISDGVLNAGVGVILNLGWDIDNIGKYIKKIPLNLASLSIAKKIISTCNHLYQEIPGDDTTVVILKLTNAKHSTIFTGPPLNEEDDRMVVGKLIKGEGKKIVCGGTAAKIVARELNQEIEIDMENIKEDIPPIGHIKDIDLVTEGVLTLKKVLEILENYKTSKHHIDDIFKNNQYKNGVYMILKILLDESTHINFLVGRSINPAHKDIDFPNNLSSKLEIVKEIKERLEDLGKIVNIEYY